MECCPTRRPCVGEGAAGAGHLCTLCPPEPLQHASCSTLVLQLGSPSFEPLAVLTVMQGRRV